jgi:hypothetical protein
MPNFFPHFRSSLIYTVLFPTFIYHQSVSTVQIPHFSAYLLICIVLTNLSLPCTTANSFSSEHAFSLLSLNHIQLLPSIALLFTRLLFIDY